MRINAFYREMLRARVKNQRWSWGARDPISNRVFLKVWADQIHRDDNGDEWVQVAWPSNLPGNRERLAQLQTIREGAEGLGVVCTATDPRAVPRQIRSFDNESLLRLGAFTDDGNVTYARIVGRVRVSTVMADNTMAQDLAELARMPADEPTTTESLIAARLGQGRFRAEVLQRWKGRCAVTGSITIEVIRASHIKPWKKSTNQERLDPENGLPLVASLDALFDAGLISFDATGQMLVAERLTDSERTILGLSDARLSQQPSSRTGEYLRHHRETFFANNLQLCRRIQKTGL